MSTNKNVTEGKFAKITAELWGVIFVVIGLAVLISIISYFINSSENILGPLFGNFLSVGLVFLFGNLPVFIFPALIIYSGIILFKGRSLPTRHLIYMSGIIFQICVLMAIHNLPSIMELKRINSNVIGNLTVQLLHYVFGKHTFGPYFLFTFTMFVTIVLMFEIDLKKLFENIRTYLLSVLEKIKNKKIENENSEEIKECKNIKTEKVTPVIDVHTKESTEEPKKPIKINTYDGEDDDTTEEVIDDERENFEDDADISGAAGLIELDGVIDDLGMIPPEEEDSVKTIPNKPYIIPSVDIISDPPPIINNLDREELEANSKLLVDTLKDFGVNGEVIAVNPGPIVTQYEIVLSRGTKINKVVNLQDDLSLAVGGKKIRIEAPIPGKSAIGIELPNKDAQIVHFKHVLNSPKFQNTKAHIPVVIGKDIQGRPFFADVQKMPHILVAGQTGAGKSVGINSIICSILMTKKPEELRLILIDPKKVEMAYYQGIPHLLSPVVTEAKEAVEALRWAVKEMERRYRLLAKIPARNIDSFNEKIREGSLKEGVISESDNKPLPFIVIIVDELADLMMTASKDVEGLIQRIAQLARAVGIHLIIATQRPSVDIITGPIKANLTSRISFRTIQSQDSRTILGSIGAEKLLGRGDMLFLRNGADGIERYHGSFISEEDVECIVSNILEQEYALDIIESFEEATGGAPDGGAASTGRMHGGSSGDRDENFEEAARLIVTNGIGSTSLIQRRLKLGYARAGRVMDELEEAGIVGPANGSKPREILASIENIEDMFGD